MFIELVFMVTLVYCILHVYRKGKGDKSRAPGPFQWPIVGNLIDIALAHPTHPDLAIDNIARKYGDIVSLKFGVHDTVVLSSFEAFRDLLGKEELADRYQGFGFISDRSFHESNSLGIIWQNGPKWRQLRNYTLRTLRNFGLNKTTSMEVFIADELNEFMEELKVQIQSSSTTSTPGTLTIIPDIFSLSFVNVMWCAVGGFRFKHTDERLIHMLELNDKTMETMAYDSITLVYPFLRHWFPKMTGYNKQMKVFTELQEFMRGLITDIRDKYMKRGGPEAEPQCYIEDFIRNQMQAEKTGEDTCFIENQLIMVLKDLFLGGSESTSSNFSYMILYMVLYPDIQKRVQQEIQSVLGNDTNPERPLTSRDLPNLPYTESTMLEIMRIACIVPLPGSRGASVDVYYKGYVIPKGCCVMMNAGSILRSNWWGDPQNFRPERFLDDTKSRVLPDKRERMVLFGWGKRICLGETLAKESTFSYFTTILRRYSLKLPDGAPTPSIISPPNMTLKPNPFPVEFIPRY